MRSLYALAGFTWGLILGALAGWSAMAFAAGVSWIFLFGDDPWPAAVDYAIPSIGLAVGLAVLTACALLGARVGAAAALGDTAVTRAKKRSGIVLLAAGWILIGALAALLASRVYQESQSAIRYTEQRSSFGQLLATRQTLVSLHVTPNPAEATFTLSIETQGQAGGAYRLSWQVQSPSYRVILAEGQTRLSLQPGDNKAEFAFDAHGLIGKYHEVAMNAAAAEAEVDERFKIELSLRLHLNDSELSRLPENEAHNLSISQSQLIDTRTFDFSAHFRINGANYRLME